MILIHDDIGPISVQTKSRGYYFWIGLISRLEPTIEFEVTTPNLIDLHTWISLEKMSNPDSFMRYLLPNNIMVTLSRGFGNQLVFCWDLHKLNPGQAEQYKLPRSHILQWGDKILI